MDDEIRVGASLLGYMTKLAEIYTEVSTAYSLLRENMELLTDPENYQGLAAGEMYSFLTYLDNHLQRFILFYDIANEYLNNTYTTYYRNEQQLIDFLLAAYGL